MEESESPATTSGQRKILKFLAGSGFVVVLEFGQEETLENYRKRIEDAGLQCERIPQFNINFDKADLFMDMRSPVCASQFDLEDWL